MPRRGTKVLAAVAIVIGTLATTSAGADTPDPSPWPQTPGVDPGIDATAHSLRIAGNDRAQTALSSALLLRGDGTYPFGTSDRTSGEATEIATGSQWWGLGTCPYAVIITAGDTAADSLAAASLSDPTDGSTEPALTRTTTADEFLAPVGERSVVDTDSAPIIVTASTRQGATNLSAAAFAAVADLADGACRTVTAAIVVGGAGAVPEGVDRQLLGLGIDEVFRVSGPDRYGTAAAIARALGTGEAPPAGTACVDPDITDGDAEMGFYGNAAVELRTSPTACTVLGRTVVLADGITGADALAAGWWTSTWQVPVLLTDADGQLPPATLDVLSSLVADNVVVLGGRARIPDATVAAVERTTGAVAHRVSGATRYETSVQMAGAFGGWFPTGDAADHDGSMVCLASSSGSGSVGWPDALGAGPWCARAGGLASGVSAPERALPPTSGPSPRVTRGIEPSHDAVPVLLTPSGSSSLADPVAQLFGGTFDPADPWCSSIQAADSCHDPGFVVAFGGTAVLPDAALRQAAQAVSGQTYVVFDDEEPSSGEGFWTQLDMAPVYVQGGAAQEAAAGGVCVDRGSLAGVRWLSGYDDLQTTGFLAEHDVLGSGGYATEASPSRSTPTCLRVPDPGEALVHALGTSLSGHTTTVGAFDAAGDRFHLSAPIVQLGAEVSEGPDTTVDDADGATTRMVFSDTDIEGVVASSRGVPAAVTSASIDITLQRGATATAPDRFTASLSFTTDLGAVVATADGEAVRVGETWVLRGHSHLSGGWNATGGLGGFAAELDPVQTDPTDDVLSWRFDSVLDP